MGSLKNVSDNIRGYSQKNESQTNSDKNNLIANSFPRDSFVLTASFNVRVRRIYKHDVFGLA